MNFFTLVNVPIPRDLGLPLPLPESFLKVLLVVFFLLHIFFVNLMVGGSLLTVVFEFLGLKKEKYDKLAQKIAETVTVNKSLAVVLGVGPLLCISLVYTAQFYAANVLTGHAWFALIPLITAAFLMTYVHKYQWHVWTARAKPFHIGLGVAAALFFLFIPLIFLSNINLMLFPEKWSEVKGFISSLKIGNVFPRYFHFLAASLAMTGLFLVGWFGRPGFSVEKDLPDFSRADLRRLFYRVAYWISLAQFAFGPILLITLPPQGISEKMLAVIFTGAAFAGLAIYIMRVEIKSDDHLIGRLYWPAVAVFTVVVLMMGTGRHLYREASLAAHKQLIYQRTQIFNSLEYAAQIRLSAGSSAPFSGKELFFQNCAACHAEKKALVGPSITEIGEIYKGNAQGISDWAGNPGKKRPNLPQMSSFAHIPEDQRKLIAEYMLEVAAGKKHLNDKDDE